MTAQVLSRDYVEHAVLQDGTRVLLRLVRPEDKELVRAGFAQLSSESRYARFLSPKSSLSEDELSYLCDLDHENHLAIGAVLDGPDDAVPVGVGIARYVRLPDRPDTAEAAITVVDAYQRRGLGKLLLVRLIAAAASRGIERFRCEVLASNAGMAALLAHITPDRTITAGAGVMSIELPLPKVELPPAGNESRFGAIYQLFRAAAQNAIDWTGSVRRMWRR